MKGNEHETGVPKTVLTASRKWSLARSSIALSGAAILLLVSAHAANAGIIITMSEAGVQGPTIVATSASDVAAFNGSFGDYTFSLNTSVSNSPGANNLATLNVSSTEIRGTPAAGSSGILTINVEADGFTAPAAGTPVFFLQSIGSNSSSSSATMTFQSSLDGMAAPLQGPLAQGTSDVSVTPFLGPLNPFPFNISNTTTIEVASGLEGSTSGSTEVGNSPNFFTPTPVPSSLILLLSSLIVPVGVVVARRRLATA
jgi:hypothetical protein